MRWNVNLDKVRPSINYQGTDLMEQINEINWITDETVTANFGDKRLNNRFKSILQTFGSKPNESIPASCKGWSETLAAYRFFDNDKVTADKILSPHYAATIQRIQNEKTILLIQDTTEINYNNRSPVNGLGPLSSDKEQGLHLHSLIAVTPERLCLGSVHADMWVRTELGKKKDRSQKPIEEKESFRWLEGYRISNAVAKQAINTEIITITDREGDIFEIFVEAIDARKEEVGAHFIIRSSANRKLNESEKKLWDDVHDSTALGSIEFEIPAAKNRQARKVTQEVRAKEIKLRPPSRKGLKLPEVKLNIVHCVELKPPKGEKPLEWLLLTSLRIDSTEEIFKVIKYYLCRWEVEIFFKILKSGCKIEELQLQDYKRLEPCIALYMIIAWRVLYLVMLGRKCPELPCNIVFDENEWKAVYAITQKKLPPSKPPLLGEIIIMVAVLGGFLNRKHDGYPGPKVIWRGIQRTRDLAIAWETYQYLQKGGDTCV
jgi:Transposase DNA-binding/Transposase Tn5 dimerisation domain